MSQVPAAGRTLTTLRVLAAAPGPMTATALAHAVGAPRSSMYHLLSVMADAGFVVHFPEEERWGLGVVAFEIGAAYLRHDPLERLATPLLTAITKRTRGVVAHLAVLHGRETMYIAKSSSRRSDDVVVSVGVRLPATLTASGRAILAALPASQVRALFPGDRTLVDRTGRGPTSVQELRALLEVEAKQGFAFEDGFIEPGLASVAAPSADRDGRAIAAIAMTFDADQPATFRATAADQVRRAARELTLRLRGA